MSNSAKSITAYFSSAGQVSSAGDQLRSILQITDPQSMIIEQVTSAEAGNEGPGEMSAISNATGLRSNVEDSDAYKMTVTVPMMMTERAMDIIRAQGGTIK
ncbi:MAG: hypothetical protein ACM3PP_08310 [Candidatus Saccharibacteria bacterium]